MRILKTPLAFPNDFRRLFYAFTKKTQENLSEVFILTMKMLLYKYRKKVEFKLRSNKNINPKNIMLKRSDITNALSLIDFRVTQGRKQILAENSMVENFGNYPEGEALEYYDQKYLKAEIKDIFGRTVSFTVDGMKYLYKDFDDEGKHTVDSKNYEMTRGKRLPWIKKVIETTEEVYREVESSWETFLYVAKIQVPIPAPEKFNIEYFYVVTRKQRGQPLNFVTAYSMSRVSSLLKRLVFSTPFTQRDYDIWRGAKEPPLATDASVC